MDTNKIVEKIKYGNVEFVLKSQKLQEKTVDPSTEDQLVLPDREYGALSKVSVNAVTNAIDSNITPENIKYGVSILGVTGEFGALKGTLNIVENGLYDVSEYSEANVTIRSSGFQRYNIMYVPAENGTYEMQISDYVESDESEKVLIADVPLKDSDAVNLYIIGWEG